LIKRRMTFIVAHRLSTIRNADKVAVLKKGHLVEFGTFDGLVAAGGDFAAIHMLYR
jgi:ABC-type multidrug transport system fused ATPase/permease subunit